MLALGDALDMAVAQTLGTTPEDFARNHPGGSLGRRLRPVSAVMRQGEMLPLLRAPAKLQAALAVMVKPRDDPVVHSWWTKKIICWAFSPMETSVD